MYLQFLVFFLLFNNCHAAEISLLDIPMKADKNDGSKIVEEAMISQDKKFNEMQDFIEEENRRLNVIKILNLDLEQRSLELKNKEIEVKLAQLDVPEDLRQEHGSLHGEKTNSAVIKLLGSFLGKGSSQAYINMDGNAITAREKDVLSDGLILEKINPNEIILKDKNGKQHSIHMDS